MPPSSAGPSLDLGTVAGAYVSWVGLPVSACVSWILVCIVGVAGGYCSGVEIVFHGERLFRDGILLRVCRHV